MIYIINSVLFALLMIVWSSKNWLNIFIKFVLFTVTCANMFCAAQSFGYLVRV